MAKILITGGAGFIGSHLAQELSQDHEIVVLDNLSGGYAENVPKGVKLIINDITNEKIIEFLFQKYRFDYVFHLAAYAAEGLSHFIRKFNYENNVIGSINLINASIKYDVKKFIFTSSMGVYGSAQAPFDEDMKPAPEDPYGIAKYAVEQDLESAQKMFGLNYVIFRPHNVYGPKQNIWDKYRNVIGIFMLQLLNGLPMTIFGDGEQVRSFSYVSDIVYGLTQSIKNSAFNSKIFNIGADKFYTINSLASEVASALNLPKNIINLAPRYEVKIAYPNHAKIQKFGIYPEIELQNGLSIMAKWAKENYDKRKSNEFLNIEQIKNIPPKWLLYINDQN